ncbi:hypothetical protein N0V94_008570 [Neodidymelliopsis sp. IMI 364377]|nr:hypothetical protein N0V94_008570 [Neodidymelliopsis sp. IMI 364377]
MMPIQLPISYQVRVPARIVVGERPTNDPPVLARNSTPFQVPDFDVPRATRAATPLARVHAQIHGFLNAGREAIAGPMNDPRLREEWDGKNGRGGNLKKLTNTLMNELYGPKSFIRVWTAGEVAIENALVSITNYDLETRALERFPPNGETDNEKDARIAEIAEYRKAIDDIRQIVRNKYGDEIDRARAVTTSNASARAKRRAEQELELYMSERDKELASRVPDGASSATADEVRSSFLLPLFSREPIVRYQFWKKRMTADILASCIGYGCEIIDIAAMLKEPRFRNLYSYRLPKVADILHRHVISSEEWRLRLQSHVDDVNLRYSVYVPIVISEVYQKIRNFDKVYRSNVDNVPTWEDVPVFNVYQRLTT